MPRVAAEKLTLREQLRAVREAHGALDDASAEVCAVLVGLSEVAASSRVLGYAATASEVSVDAALRRWIERGIVVALPWVRDTQLGVAAVSDLDAAVTPGWRGVREPAAPRALLSPQDLDVVVVPGLGFDAAGNRLGYGGGHFDRLLADAPRALRIGVALDEQIVEHIPSEPHDQRMDLIVTPRRTLRCTRL